MKECREPKRKWKKSSELPLAIGQALGHSDIQCHIPTPSLPTMTQRQMLSVLRLSSERPYTTLNSKT